MKKILLILVLLILSISMVTAQIASGTDVVVSNPTEVTNTLVNQNPDPAEPGAYVELRFKVENLGGEATKNAIFEIIPEFPFSLDPGKSPQLRLGTIESNQVGNNAYVLYYKMKVDEKAVEGNNNIRLKYSVDNGLSWTLLAPFTVRVQTLDSILAVQSVVSEPQVIEPGEKAKLTIQLKNQANNPLKNIRVNLQLRETLTATTSVTQVEHPFTPLGSSNEKTYSSISPGETLDVEFEMMADPTGTIGVHKIPLSITYTDNVGTSYSKSYIIGLIIGEQPDLIITVEEDTPFIADSTQNVVIKFINKGNSNLKFVNVNVHENGVFTLLSQPQVYVGNIDSDDFETAEFTINFKANAPKDVEIPFKLEFKDQNNNNYEQETHAHVRLYTKEEVELTQPKKNMTATIISWVVILVIIVGVVWLVRRRRSKKTR